MNMKIFLLPGRFRGRARGKGHLGEEDPLVRKLEAENDLADGGVLDGDPERVGARPPALGTSRRRGEALQHTLRPGEVGVSHLDLPEHLTGAKKTFRSRKYFNKRAAKGAVRSAHTPVCM